MILGRTRRARECREREIGFVADDDGIDAVVDDTDPNALSGNALLRLP